MSRRIAVCLLGAHLLAQPSPPAESLRLAVFRYLEASDAKSAATILRALRSRPDFTVPEVAAVLAAGPQREGGPTGSRVVPFQIPGTSVWTEYGIDVPEGPPPKGGYPLWIVSHGTGGFGPPLVPGMASRLAAHRAIIVAPSEGDDLRAGGWGYRHRERELHIAMIEEVARQYPVDRDRVVVMGWSRGGHGSFDLAVRYPDRFAGAGPIIGSVPFRDRALLVNPATVTIFAINGARDQPELVVGAKAAVARLRELRYPVHSILDEARGHAMFEDRLPEMVTALIPARRDLTPRDYSFATYDLAYDRRSSILIRQLSGEAYRPGKAIPIEGSSKMTEDQRREAYLSWVDEHTPRIRVRFEAGVFTVEAKFVKQFDLFVPLAFVDPAGSLEVRVNGEAVKRAWKVRPDASTLLELTREFGGADAGYRFAAKTRITVR